MHSVAMEMVPDWEEGAVQVVELAVAGRSADGEKVLKAGNEEGIADALTGNEAELENMRLHKEKAKVALISF